MNDKQNVVYLYERILANNKKEYTIDTNHKWMNPKITMLSERNRTEKGIKYMVLLL